MNSTTSKQVTKDERLNQWKPKILCKPAQNFVKCSPLKFLSFVHKIVPRYLSVAQALLLFAAPPIFIVLLICERK